jgi:hypothetical protein
MPNLLLLAWGVLIAATIFWLLSRSVVPPAPVTDSHGWRVAEFARDLARWDRDGRPDG